MHALVRRLRKDERGQAMLLGALSMLVLVVAVLATVSIGSGVYEKIKLQDAADAQAYSTAVREARAYNFIAYVNRAMVVHYNAMLTIMGYLSHAQYLENTVGRAASVLKYIPYIGSIFSAVEQIIKAWRQVVDGVAQVLIPILTYLNVGMWVAEEAVLTSTFIDLLSESAQAPLSGTDPRSSWGYNGGKSNFGGYVSFFYQYDNAKNFLHPVDDGPSSNGNIQWSDPTGLVKRAKQYGQTKLSEPDTAKYRLLMNNVVNGARREWTAEGMGPMLIGRRWDVNLCFLIGKIIISKVAETKIRSFHESYNNNIKDQLYSMDGITIKVKGPSCWFGKTKTILDYRTDIAADYQKGYHRESLSGGFGSVSKRDHFWQGITPFIHSDTSFIDPKIYHFSYPCNFSLATKNISSSPPLFNLTTNYRVGEGKRPDSGKLDLSVNSLQKIAMGDYWLSLTGGMMAVSVGRAVYHRPGAWKEEPNFFNPLWTARLAAVRTHWQKQYMLEAWPFILPFVPAITGTTVNYMNY